jgi:hypothetical protein
MMFIKLKWENGIYSDNVGILDFSEIYEVDLSIYFESEGTVTQIISQVVTENVYLCRFFLLN